MKKWILRIASTMAILYCIARVLPFPIVENNSTTLVLPTAEAHVATARSLGHATWGPKVMLNTSYINRFLFYDGTSVDHVVKASSFTPMYRIVAIKQVVLPIWSWQHPRKIAENMAAELIGSHFVDFQIEDHPDPDVPEGDVVLLLASAFKTDENSGFAVLVRKNAFRIALDGGPAAKSFAGFN